MNISRNQKISTFWERALSKSFPSLSLWPRVRRDRPRLGATHFKYYQPSLDLSGKADGAHTQFRCQILIGYER